MSSSRIDCAVAELRAAFAEAGVDNFTINLTTKADGERLRAYAEARMSTIVEAYFSGLRHNASIAGVPVSWPDDRDGEPMF